MKILLSLISCCFFCSLDAENEETMKQMQSVPMVEKGIEATNGSLNKLSHEIDQLKQRICDLLPSIYGWCSREKALTLIDLTLQLKPKVCVDIGVFGGSSLFPVAFALKFLGSGVVIGIDPWEKFESVRYLTSYRDEPHLRWWAQVDHGNIYNSYLKSVKQFGLENFCITRKMTSQRAAPTIDQIDLLHIDGNHSEECFTYDTKAYLPLVRPGGYILLNDSLWENAQPAIDLLLEQCDMITLIDCGNCIVFKKR